MKFALSVLVAARAVGAGTGCSQGKQAGSWPATTGTTTPTASPRLSPAERHWVKQVNAACKPWQNRIDAVTPAPTNDASLQKWLKRALPLISQQVAAVQAVKRPANADDAKKVKLFTDGVQRTERALTRYLAAVRAHEPAQVSKKALADAGASGAATRVRAAALGVTGCGGQ